jgi:hypothetical protein
VRSQLLTFELSLDNYVLERLGLSFELPELPVMERLAFTVVSWLQRFKAPCASTASSSKSFIGSLIFSRHKEYRPR